MMALSALHFIFRLGETLIWIFMNFLTWQADAFGTYNLHTPEGAHFWIESRPYYCDRGHWSLNSNGVNFEKFTNSLDNIEPAHYFQQLDTAIREAELWVAKLAGQSISWECEESLPPGLKYPWTLEKFKYSTEVQSEEGRVLAIIEMLGTEEDPLWKFQVEGIPSLDAADFFPRYFLRLEHAVIEAEEFLRWRLEKSPTESHEAIERPDQPIAPYIQDALNRQKIKNVKPS